MIDYWCNAFTPDRAPLWEAVIEGQGLSIRTRGAGDADDFATPADMVARMDRLDISALILPVCEVGDDAPLEDFAHYAVHREEMDDLAGTHHDRFFGAFSVNPDAGHSDVAAAADTLEAQWCVALHTHTHSWDRRFDDAAYTPYYKLCAAAHVPFVMQAGASGGRFPHECGHPSAIAGPARAFPDVDFVLSHTGAPWVDETIAAAAEFANVVIGTATHPPRRWPDELLRFITGPGHSKAIFGTGFPLTGHARSLNQLADLDLDAATRHELLEGNATRIFSRIPQTGD